MSLFSRFTRGRKRTGLINQFFIQQVLTQSRIKRRNERPLTHSLFVNLYRNPFLHKEQPNPLIASLIDLRLQDELFHTMSI